MGKYHFKLSHFDNSILESSKDVQLWIANELAEANRLKRLEMKLKDYDYLNSNEAYEKLLKDLEDQA